MRLVRFVQAWAAGVWRLLLTGVAAGLLLCLLVAGVVLLPLAGLGVPVLVGVFALVRLLAAEERAAAGRRLDASIPEPAGLRFIDEPGPSVWRRFGRLLGSDAFWRYLGWTVWQAVAGLGVPLLMWASLFFGWTFLEPVPGGGGALVLAPVALGLLALPFLVGLPVLRRLAAVSRWFLAAPEHRSDLSRRVDELARTRAATVEAQDAVMRRVERDLHDGTQAHVVATGMTIGLARTLLREQPERADELLAEAERTIGQTLQELRATVHGIRPPVLAERGLTEAVRALCLRSRIPVEQHIALDEPAGPAVETAVYFALAEAITNVNRHSGAGRARLELCRSGSALHAAVWDDGHGGADPGRGSGLAGLRGRLAGVDGTVQVVSPAGGPTEIRMEVPCAPSSPRTSPFSGTG
ncbi:sensor histidine kinase [Pseudonocardia phyllosphaerae]|uniref:sensor histidine kinase n=1 Tax=Pseudonocardia phyllosphaerae TaxID=3390502 RepID=UPI00397E60A4